MDVINWFIEFVLHMDKHLPELVKSLGLWSYAALFAVIFVETGLVIFPFLPGDSLLFAAGAVAAIGGLDVLPLFVLMALAAVLGDTVNYWIGHTIGPRAFSGNVRFLKKEYLDRTQAFYEKHGGKTIFLARFVPIVRTGAPFVAGLRETPYRFFLLYNVFGAVAWVAIFVSLGYFFGSLPVVHDHFALAVGAVLIASGVPGVYEWCKARRRKRREGERRGGADPPDDGDQA